jgi:DNA-binding NarL/FixJ family response regulator
MAVRSGASGYVLKSCAAADLKQAIAPSISYRDYQSRNGVMRDRPRVVVADDHLAMLNTLIRLLSSECDVVAAVGDGFAALSAAARLEPDVLVLDIAMPGLSGIAAAAQMKARGLDAKVVFVTNLHDREFVEQTSALGPVGYVVKDRLVADLVPAVLHVLAGYSFVSASVR